MYKKYIKRLLDIILATIALLFALPITLFIAIAIKLDDGGPVFFKHKRYGQNKQPFTIYKFRTMYVDAPHESPTNQLANHQQHITRVGKLLRVLSLDELPQLINVLRGNMSIVGPRPVILAETDLIAERDKYDANSCKPGITGWAQVNGRDELRMAKKAKMDGEYAYRLGFIMDLKCVLYTIYAVFSLKGHREGVDQEAATYFRKMQKQNQSSITSLSECKSTKYSIVMPIYHKDRSEWFEQAIKSLLDQTVISNDIVIVADGPLTPQLDAVLSQYVNQKTISLIRLPVNKGLGNALNVGIEQAKNELIGRMDSDDVAVPGRFELQVAEFTKNPKLDILGGQIAEFIDSTDKIVAYRKVPTSHHEIKQFARRRSPFNHPTVMFKKSLIQRLGGYDASAIRIEDYDLWLRALANGATCANIDAVLLYYRSTTDAMKRRKTFTSLKNHVKARARFYSKKYISLPDFAYGVVTQTILFILPAKLTTAIFKKVVRDVQS